MVVFSIVFILFFSYLRFGVNDVFFGFNLVEKVWFLVFVIEDVVLYIIVSRDSVFEGCDFVGFF